MATATLRGPQQKLWASLPPLTGSSLLDPWRIRLRLSLAGSLDPPPPRSPTRSEEVLWAALSELGVGWCREYATGPYRLDFYLPDARFAVEVDGASHWGRLRANKDALRDEWHRLQGVETFRISDAEVLEHLDWVLEEIGSRIETRPVERRSPLTLPPDAPLAPEEQPQTEELSDVIVAWEAEIEAFAGAACRTILPADPHSRRALLRRLLNR